MQGVGRIFHEGSFMNVVKLGTLGQTRDTPPPPPLPSSREFGTLGGSKAIPRIQHKISFCMHFPFSHDDIIFHIDWSKNFKLWYRLFPTEKKTRLSESIKKQEMTEISYTYVNHFVKLAGLHGALQEESCSYSVSNWRQDYPIKRNPSARTSITHGECQYFFI